MEIWQHTVISAIITAVLWPFFSWWSLLVLVGGVLIDSDHVLWYYYRRGDFNLRKVYSYCRAISDNKDTKEYKKAVLIFHSYEALVVLAVLSFFIPQFVLLLIGVIEHMLSDFLYTLYKWRGPYSLVVFRKSAIVFLYDFFTKIL
ncbi:MAG: hypothetical protein ISS25_01510 [Nanoarchaeota archaeon]|nr:hypothetical protein [DPANN group archaeon]MBL7116490.1 hypothetical protein [Nanoarchaeota archaeon]